METVRQGDITWTAVHITHVDGEKCKPTRWHIAEFDDGVQVFLSGAEYDRFDDAGILEGHVRGAYEDEGE